ncbi:MAG: lysine--tRNA ligase [Candidatus Cloacimonetes bacterium]|nr:lysine--tRNA ligase [Candidatus Cloacimonadota bacterium]
MHSDNEMLRMRREKLDTLADMNISAYPARSARTHTIDNLLANEDAYIAGEERVIIAGRLNSKRRMGKAGFANLRDAGGVIQLFIRKNDVGNDAYELFKLLDLGDFVQAEGTCFHTRTGEYSVKVEKLVLLSKSLRMLPTVKEQVLEDGTVKRFDEFADIELRYRKRYLDLLLNPERRRTFEVRAQFISAIRRFLDERGFLEVETPVLQSLYGGANARPFVTHHHTLDTDFFLRIATELYLKRLVIGGIERVYEMGKNFRNEGMDRTHNPEFTLLEVYQAYADYNDIMELTEEMIRMAAQAIFGEERLTFQGEVIELAGPWRRASMLELIQEHAGYDASHFDADRLRAFYKQHELEPPAHAGPGKLIEELFAHFCEPKLVQPTFVTDFPREVSPLAKRREDDDRFVERFELYIAGYECANAFSELNDPIDQRTRLEAQAALRDLGDLEANVVDEDFLEAMEYGMPPTGGLGIGIDRMVMLFTDNVSIKEVILFPQMKREG